MRIKTNNLMSGFDVVQSTTQHRFRRHSYNNNKHLNGRQGWMGVCRTRSIGHGCDVSRSEEVWFQNARAKYRRNLLKQQDSTEGSKSGQGQTGPGSPEGHDMKDGVKDTGSTCDMNAGSPALSDISSTPSLSDIQSSNMETDHNSSSNNSISDLFSSTIATIN
ncbi:LIM/homeobox protein Lhx9 [Elysia marginata]|uniref:LIM/homeobox protein Lhx9 n=1 Tax=Elysia marginata TaxID=1093978 RepID=A0AAV4FQ37_9GAST|nr:LIM/homeobox protein Lhx9 [Elysia marginata]